MMTSSPAADVRISLLGGVSVHLADGAVVDPLPPKCQELLASLALDPGTPITVGRLVELMWGDDPPRTAEKTLQTYVARLRRELGNQAIVRAGAAYRLDVDAAAIDTSRFRAALRAGDVETALTEWSGPPLVGIVSDRLQPLVDGLTEEWLDAVEMQLERKIDEDPGSVVGRLTELAAAHPFREGLCALLMTALYRTDRQAEALDTYRRTRGFLIDQLGVEPGPRLRELEQLILHQDAGLASTADPARRRRSVTPAPTGTVTFGFVELDTVPDLWSKHLTTAAEVVAVFADISRALADSYGGVVFSSGMEGFGVAFSGASDACAWAIALHAELETTQWPHSQPTHARVGLHTGETDERNGFYYGPAVRLAQQLATAAAPGQTIATAITSQLSGWDHQHLGSFPVDGTHEVHELHQIGKGSFRAVRIGPAINQLPRPAHSLIGRDELTAQIARALATAPVVTLVGPGGIGKTRLAIEVARRADRHTNRTWFVSFSEIVDSTDVARAFADAIGAQESQGRNLIDTIAASLDARPSLVVLDNCEHIVDGVAGLVEALTSRCPDLTVLATSREALGIDAEQIQPIGPLDAETAGVELFIERALALDPDLELDRATVAAVCQRLDGVPLAIELSAATARSLTPRDLLDRLHSIFTVLTGTKRRTLDRHQTLHATIQWSYDLLTRDEQTLFRRLAVFSGSFDLRAAEHVAADQDLPKQNIGALLSDLVDRSMCLVESSTTGRRFRLLEPMRQFGFEHLHVADTVGQLQQRHAEHTRDRITIIQRLVAGQSEIQGAAELAELWPSLRSAIDYAIEGRNLPLARQLIEPVAAQGFLRRGLGELGDWFARIVELPGAREDDTVDVALLWTALYAQQSENREPYDRLLTLRASTAGPLSQTAMCVIDGDSEGLIASMPLALAEAERRGDHVLTWILQIINTGNLVQVGRLDAAHEYLSSVMEQPQTTLPPTLLSWMLFMEATLGELRDAEVSNEDPYDAIASIALPPRTNSPAPTLAARRAARLGDYHGAYTALREHVDDLHAGNSPNGALVVAHELINICLSAGNSEEAASILGYLDAAGADDIAGFDKMLSKQRRRIEADPTTASIRSAAAKNATPDTLLLSLADSLTALLAST